MGENCIETQRLIQMIRGFNMEQMILRNEIGGYILENVLVKPCISYIYIYVGKCINFSCNMNHRFDRNSSYNM